MPEHQDELREIDGIKPKIWLEEGEDREVESQSSSSKYKVKRTYDHYYCTCPAWRNNGQPVNGRTCKHLKNLLGEEYELARMKLKNPEGPDAKKAAAAKGKKAAPAKEKKEPKTKATGSVRAGAKRKTRQAEEAETEEDEDEEEEDEEEQEEQAKPTKGKGAAKKAAAPASKAKATTSRTKRSRVKSEEADEEDEDIDMAEYKDMPVDELETTKQDLLKRIEKIDTLLKSGKGKSKAKTAAKKPEKKTVTGKGKRNAQEDEDEDEDEEEDEEEEDEEEEEEETKKPAKKKKTDLLLAEKWDLEKGIDPTGWLISEKLDGVRALWDGEAFRSREGNLFYAPDWFIKKFPKDTTFDGELTAGRGTFQDIVSIVKAQGLPNNWKFKVEFHVFDTLSMPDKPFEERYEFIKNFFKKTKIQWVKVVEHTECKGKDHLMEELQKITDEKGEGLMLREPGSLYVGKRSKTLLKVKKFLDADAEIIGYEKGKGRNEGVTGALKCRMLDDKKKEFKVGTGLSDKIRKNPPKIGTTIIYRYFELTKDGVPRFPSYVGERAD